MATARERAREAALKTRNYAMVNDHLVPSKAAADAASDVWEPLLLHIDKIQREWWDGDVPMNVALSEIRQICQEALGDNRGS